MYNKPFRVILPILEHILYIDKYFERWISRIGISGHEFLRIYNFNRDLPVFLEKDFVQVHTHKYSEILISLKTSQHWALLSSLKIFF